MKNDAFAVGAAEAIKVDILITERDYLFEMPLILSKNVAEMRPLEALPVVGLYLR